jgi:uncharacterized protein (TIGR00266 family)
VQSGSYLAGETGIEIETKWGGARSFFGSEGLFLLHLKGSGQSLVSSFGAIHRITLDGTNDLIIDTGHVVAFGPGVQWRVKKVSGLLTSLISGEGLVCEFSGRGDVWLQTRSNQAFLADSPAADLAHEQRRPRRRRRHHRQYSGRAVTSAGAARGGFGRRRAV